MPVTLAGESRQEDQGFGAIFDYVRVQGESGLPESPLQLSRHLGDLGGRQG